MELELVVQVATFEVYALYLYVAQLPHKVLILQLTL